MEEEKQKRTGGNARYTGRKKLPVPSKISNEKVYNYIKKIEVDGLPRVRAYAEAIDKHIYDLSPQEMAKKLDYFKANCKSYDDIKEMVLAEQQDWALRRSAALQEKAVNLLYNLLDRANQIATDPNNDVKDLKEATAVLKTVMPAFTAMGNKSNDAPNTDRKARAGKFIN